MCFDSSIVRREQQPAKSRGIGKGTGTERGTGRGTGRGTVRGIGRGTPGTSGERVITPRVYQDAALINIDIGYKPQGLKWNGGDDVTASQLQRISQSRKNKRGTSSAPKNA
ncbi:hypothetical protein R3W88_023554 [Solanum pinnatisectum]|uniref:Uncharacterized protein n=1 Tax=Solanum pinnatisectum TaxID=50273 RepID=A0AAV9LY06_9SOLN|nr:hypothetical protein R3W88_023554 [Solanum pinnatisectum]